MSLTLNHQTHFVEIVQTLTGYQANLKNQDGVLSVISHPGFTAAETLKAAIDYIDTNTVAETAGLHLAKLGLPDHELAPIYSAIDTLVEIATRP
ncbi:MAG: hypothetical protein ACRC62_18145 [Microcoleus sp.]